MRPDVWDYIVGGAFILASVVCLVVCWLGKAADAWDANLARNIEAVERDANPRFYNGLYLEQDDAA